MQLPFLPLFAAALLAVFSLVTQTAAQVIYGDFTNSRVHYLQVTESGLNIPPVLFGAPTSVSSPESQLTFAPSTFVQSDPSLPFDLKTKSSQLQVDIQAAPGLWFTGDALQLYTSGSYSLVAPFGPVPQSQAFASFSASYTLLVNEVDNNPFSAGAPLSANVAITPSGASIVGPGGSSGGTWNGSVVLDINTIKAHFGIAPSSNVTGMLLQYTANLAAAGVYGQAQASLLNLSLVDANLVPEPSICGLLLMTGAGALWWARRRKGN